MTQVYNPGISTSVDPLVHSFFETSTATWQWVVADPISRQAIIIDPVLDNNDRGSSRGGIGTTAADQILQTIAHHHYHVIRILETHGQRQVATAGWYLRAQLGNVQGEMPRISTGKSLVGVRRMFARQYGIRDAGWASKFDAGFQDGERFPLGQLECEIVDISSSRNPDRYAFVVGENVITGDANLLSSGGRVDNSQENAALVQRLRSYAGFCFHPGSCEEASPKVSVSTGRPSTAMSSRQFMSEGTYLL